MRAGSRGFTLIEVLVVLVLAGILAVIAIPRVSAARERAYVATMKSDLRNLVAAQAAYFATHEAYAAALPTGFHSSGGVTLVMDSATSTGWGARASHDATSATCTVATGPSGQASPTCAP